jgi:hypothetical protein
VITTNAQVGAERKELIAGELVDIESQATKAKAAAIGPDRSEMHEKNADFSQVNDGTNHIYTLISRGVLVAESCFDVCVTRDSLLQSPSLKIRHQDD